MDILVLYATLEGQTTKIAERITERLRNHHQVVTQSTDQLPADFSLSAFDAAIIAGPIHMGLYPKPLRKFARQHHDWLNQHPSALVTVCMAIRSQRPESKLEAEKYQQRFMHESQWHPVMTVNFAGAVKYTQYGLITRFIMKMIAKREGGSTDTSRDHEYTDWDAVTRFADQFTAQLDNTTA